MQEVNVRLKFNNRVHTFFSNFELKKNDFVVVKTDLGEGFGQVESIKSTNKSIDDSCKMVIRLATEKDLQQYEKMVDLSRLAVKTTQQLAEQLQLDMKVVNAEYSFDLSKVVIDFIADDRVDFRDLIKELVSNLKTRIELKQIGTREQAQLVGGIGICGRVCCCSTHLKDFEKVSIKMAKTQNLALNPSKISGACGRLMCCLSYENDYYSEISKIMPKLNSEVDTPDGIGTVVYQDFLKQKVSIKFTNKDGGSTIKDYELSLLKHNKKSNNSSISSHNQREQNLTLDKNSAFNENLKSNNDKNTKSEKIETSANQKVLNKLEIKQDENNAKQIKMSKDLSNNTQKVENFNKNHKHKKFNKKNKEKNFKKSNFSSEN